MNNKYDSIDLEFDGGKDATLDGVNPWALIATYGI